jgi:hypothetical protein
MPNVIKYSVGATPIGCLRKGNILIGNNTVDYGSTFYNGINPPNGGYTIYLNKVSGGPSIYCPSNDTQLINITNKNIAGTVASPSSFTTAAQCLNYFAGQTDKLATNFDYPNIVTSGSLLNLDAGFVGSYPTTASTWYDLSGNASNGTLTNGPTFDSANSGSIVFDGVDDFVPCTGSFTLTSATFVTWIKRNGDQGQYDGILFSRGTNTTGMNFFSSNQLGYHWNDAAATYNWASGLTIPNLTWCMIAVSVSSNSATAYLCQTSGITTATNTTSHASSVLNDIKIAQDDAGSRFFNGNIAISQLYNRALSTNEITQNFNALKGRFGL